MGCTESTGRSSAWGTEAFKAACERHIVKNQEKWLHVSDNVQIWDFEIPYEPFTTRQFAAHNGVPSLYSDTFVVGGSRFRLMVTIKKHGHLAVFLNNQEVPTADDDWRCHCAFRMQLLSADSEARACEGAYTFTPRNRAVRGHPDFNALPVVREAAYRRLPTPAELFFKVHVGIAVSPAPLVGTGLVFGDMSSRRQMMHQLSSGFARRAPASQTSDGTGGGDEDELPDGVPYGEEVVNAGIIPVCVAELHPDPEELREACELAQAEAAALRLELTRSIQQMTADFAILRREVDILKEGRCSSDGRSEAQGQRKK
ncbi:hypothetical protein DIPPA_14642 [Diplonema papillatum]|nr:hypothetical protein DIPPA_14642 [Diplonema papillatum]